MHGGPPAHRFPPASSPASLPALREQKHIDFSPISSTFSPKSAPLPTTSAPLATSVRPPVYPHPQRLPPSSSKSPELSPVAQPLDKRERRRRQKIESARRSRRRLREQHEAIEWQAIANNKRIRFLQGEVLRLTSELLVDRVDVNIQHLTRPPRQLQSLQRTPRHCRLQPHTELASHRVIPSSLPMSRTFAVPSSSLHSPSVQQVHGTVQDSQQNQHSVELTPSRQIENGFQIVPKASTKSEGRLSMKEQPPMHGDPFWSPHHLRVG